MKRFLKILSLLLGFGAAAVLVVAFWIYRDLHRPVTHGKSDTYIDIPKGSPPSEIIARLQTEGIVKHQLPILLYLRMTGDYSRLKAGDYRFPSPISPLTVLRKLKEGEQRLARFTVIEGWTRLDIAEAMAHIPELHLSGPEDALSLMDDTSQIREFAPEAKNLEGYLFPDTYSFAPDTTAAQMISGMVRRFKQTWKPEWTTQAKAYGRTPEQILTVASLIETEAKLMQERPIVASVIYNRLKLHMPLGIDSTVVYASKIAGAWRNDGKVYRSDLERQSPYNTRLNIGLPPGPIGSPGASSIEAALNPAQTDYLYYVREPNRNDGTHNFYNNASDFERGVQALRNWEKVRDSRGGSTGAPNGAPR
jgi:UPF0755 protein